MPHPHLDAAGHPRPQLIRDPDWRDLGGPWQFAHDDEDRGRADRWMDPANSAPFTGTVTVPYPPESAASSVADTAFHPVLWYRRTIDAARPAAGRRLLLHFGAVDHRAEVWLGGRLVGRHEGGHTGFTCDLTDAIDRDGEQTVVVRAEDQPLDAAQPRGKQDWRRDPHVIWYHRTSGIWQPVWLEEVPAEHRSAAEDTPVDRATSYLGLRDIGWDDGVFLLNHKPYFLRFALQQGYWPASHLSASAEELRRDVELAKEIGLNGLRIHQKVEDPRFLYWADRLGLLLWEEMPSAYAFGTQTVERVVAEWTEAISRDLSHPSIVAWVPI
ncbi:glycoside hydrolase family 2 protein, partial [Streptomyces sp. MCAF7]